MASVALAACAVAGAAAPAPAQDSGPPRWLGDVAFTAGNAALGGVASGVAAHLRGRSFWDAFRGGALGGAVTYGGRRLAAERFDGAGFAGREVAAVGASMVRNAASGVGLLDEVVLPVGPVRVYLRPRAGADAPPSARLKVDLPTLVVVGWMALRSDTRFDAAASLSAGTPVFTTHERGIDGWVGFQAAGVVRLEGDPDDRWPDAPRPGVLAHERVHVLQYDFTHLAWGAELDAWAARGLPAGGWIARHVDLGLHVGAWGLANGVVPYDHRPWEQEAHFLSDVEAHRE